MGIYNWFFGGNTARPTTGTVSCCTTELNSKEEDRIRKLENTVNDLTKLLKYTPNRTGGIEGRTDEHGFGRYEHRLPTFLSIEFPGGIKRTIQKIEASENIVDTKPKSKKK